MFLHIRARGDFFNICDYPLISKAGYFIGCTYLIPKTVFPFPNRHSSIGLNHVDAVLGTRDVIDRSWETNRPL